MRNVIQQYRSFILILAVICAGILRAGEAVAEAPGRLALSTDRVVIFKDGYALFAKKASAVADAEGRVFTEQVPDGAVLGCFWAMAENKVLSMRAEWDERQTERSTETNCVSTLELLRANKGKAVKLGSINNTSVIFGTVLEVLELPPDLNDPALRVPVAAHANGAAWRRNAGVPETETPTEFTRALEPRGGHLVVVDTVDQGRLVLPVAEVRTVSGTDLVTKMARREMVYSRTKRLSFELGKENAGKKADLQIYYFTEGVRWIPTYRVGADKADSAEISLQGEILNEAEDISDAAIDLVVGVPNFRFKTTPSPLAMEQMMRSSLAVAAPGLMGNNAYSNASFQQRHGEFRQDAPAAGGDAVALARELAAGAQSDMFVYSRAKLSLKKGARATLPLWQSNVALRNLYTLDLKVVRDARSGYSVDRVADGSRPRSPLKLAENEVWHQFELTNSANVPWTTGAALILRGGVPLGQELLTYTPLGGKTLLPVTVAINMCGSMKEEEIARQDNALKWNGDNYALVRKKVTVSVSNFRTEKSVTRVSVSTGGKAQAVSDGGVVKLNDSKSDDWQNSQWFGINNHSDVSWDLEMAPGEIKTLTFEVGFYIR